MNHASLSPPLRPAPLTCEVCGTEIETLAKSGEPLCSGACWIESRLIRRAVHGCWNWRQHKGADNDANRIAYEHHFGPVPAGSVVTHIGRDNPHCVNPQHLTLNGAAAKPIGSMGGKLHQDDVLVIYRSVDPTPYLAQKYGVTEPTIVSIQKGDTWSRITGAPKRVLPPKRGRPFSVSPPRKPAS